MAKSLVQVVAGCVFGANMNPSKSEYLEGWKRLAAVVAVSVAVAFADGISSSLTGRKHACRSSREKTRSDKWTISFLEMRAGIRHTVFLGKATPIGLRFHHRRLSLGQQAIEVPRALDFRIISRKIRKVQTSDNMRHSVIHHGWKSLSQL